MANRERCSEMVSSVSVGRCAMSIVFLLLVLRRPPYDAVRGWCGFRRASVRPPPRIMPPGGGGGVPGGLLPPRRNRWCSELLLGVELDDQLLLDRGVDD